MYKYFCQVLDGPAWDYLQTLSPPMKLSWILLRQALISYFKTPLSIREKIYLRKNLKQRKNESVELFYKRCLSAQELLLLDDEEFQSENSRYDFNSNRICCIKCPKTRQCLMLYFTHTGRCFKRN